MELKDYIKNTIISISDAIVESQLQLDQSGVIVNPEKVEIGKSGEKSLRSDGWRYVQNLDFEILVGVEEDEGIKGSAGLKVQGFLSIGGDKNESSKEQKSNKLRFTIPVAFPTTETPTKYKKRNPSTISSG